MKRHDPESRRLTLSKETLRILDDDALADVAGASGYCQGSGHCNQTGACQSGQVCSVVCVNSAVCYNNVYASA